MDQKRGASVRIELTAVALLATAWIALAGCDDDDTAGTGGQGLATGGAGGAGGATGGTTSTSSSGSTSGQGGGGKAPTDCGDGNEVDPEECDDGNLLSHDGCSSGCTLEVPTWTELVPPTSPPIRADHAMAYDAARDRLVMFGGYHAGALADTWEFGSDWTEMSPSTTPTARYDHELVFDPSGPQAILFGGAAGGLNGLAETWHYDGSDWTPGGAGPARYHHAMTVDTTRATVVVFGGTHQGTALGDTWEYAAQTWTQITPTASPPARLGAAMAYNPTTGRAVLFGGFDGNGSVAYDDTWEYDYANGTWSPNQTATTPPHRRFHHMAYDAARNRVVMFGGYDGAANLTDTWEYVSGDWVETSPSPSPQGGPLAYDSLRRRVVMSEVTAGNPHAKTWVYQLGSDWPDELCTGGDDDGDGLTDCDDPDCEGFPCSGGTCSGGTCQ